MTLEILSIRDRDLINRIWHEFEQYNSGIGYVSCGVTMNNHDYTITTFPDGSMQAIVEDATDAGGLEEDLEAARQRYRPVPTTGGTLLLDIEWDAAAPNCYCNRTKLTELWNVLLRLKGQASVQIQWIEELGC